MVIHVHIWYYLVSNLFFKNIQDDSTLFKCGFDPFKRGYIRRLPLLQTLFQRCFDPNQVTGKEIDEKLRGIELIDAPGNPHYNAV